MEYQLRQLKQVSQLLVLKPDDCVQVDLESEACNPYARGESLPPCVNACSACTGKNKMFRVVIREGVMRVLKKIYQIEFDGQLPSILNDDLPKKIMDIATKKNATVSIFTGASKPKLSEVKGLVLQLLVSEILEPINEYQKDDTNFVGDVRTKLAYRNEDCIMCDPSSWDGIPCGRLL
jgi:hypothetical protein